VFNLFRDFFHESLSVIYGTISFVVFGVPVLVFVLADFALSDEEGTKAFVGVGCKVLLGYFDKFFLTAC